MFKVLTKTFLPCYNNFSTYLIWVVLFLLSTKISIKVSSVTQPSNPLNYIILPLGIPALGLFDIIKSKTSLPVDIQFLTVVGSIWDVELTSYDTCPTVFENYLFITLVSSEFKLSLSITNSSKSWSWSIYFFGRAIIFLHK